MPDDYDISPFAFFPRFNQLRLRCRRFRRLVGKFCFDSRLLCYLPRSFAERVQITHESAIWVIDL
jgi:hypothetical protein